MELNTELHRVKHGVTQSYTELHRVTQSKRI